MGMVPDPVQKASHAPVIYRKELLDSHRNAELDDALAELLGCSVQCGKSVDIQVVADKKGLAAAAHESQWDPYIDKFAPMTDDVRQKLVKAFADRAPKRRGRIVEYFRRAQY